VLASIVVRLVAAAALVWTSFALLISTGDRRPQRLTIVPSRAFVVPAVRRIRRLRIRQSLLAMTICSAIALDAGAEPDVHTLQLIARVSNAIVAVLCLATAAVLIVGWRRPPLALTPRGVQSFLGTITWERVDAMSSLPRRYPSAHARGARHPDEYERLSQAIAATGGT
jgi:hypothetical protein